MIALRFLREAAQPIGSSDILPALSGWLERDIVTAFLGGAALAFVMHSSVATILMIVTVVSIGALPFDVGLLLVLGANLGSALIPIWLSRGMDVAARRILWANLFLRGGMAVLLLLPAQVWASGIPAVGGGGGGGQVLVVAHVTFNAAVLVLGAPLRGLAWRATSTIWPNVPRVDMDIPGHHRSMLDEICVDRPRLALVSLRREVLRIVQLAEEMITPAMSLFADFDKGKVASIRQREALVNAAFDGVRRYGARMAQVSLDRGQTHELRELIDYAIALEAAADIVCKNLITLAKEKADKQLRFSDAGQSELETLHARVLANLNLASRVLMSGDVESAKLLLSEKDEMRARHRETRKQHLKRIIAGEQVSFHSRDIHLETAHSFKEFNALVATVALPILFREGLLLDTRLTADSHDSAIHPDIL